VNYYPPRTGGKVNLTDVLLAVVAAGVWVLVIAGTNAI